MAHFVNEAADIETVTKWLNNIGLSQDTAEKVELLHMIQEILLRKNPSLLLRFLHNVLNFVTERNQEVKKVLVGFIEEACKANENVLTKVMFNLHMMLCDESIAVQKRVIQAAITVYRIMVGWMCRNHQPLVPIPEDAREAWATLCQIKREIANMIDSDNDGVRTSSVKFLECVVLVQSYCDQNEPKAHTDLSLDDVPLSLKILRRSTLEEEADTIFAILVKFNGSPHISSANLFVCIGVLTNIARLRPEYMGQVVAALAGLHTNLPPTLSSTQVTAVRKKLKNELSTLVKHPAGQDYIDVLQTRLIELGCSHIDFMKLIPRIDAHRRRQYNTKRTLATSSLSEIDANDQNTGNNVKRVRFNSHMNIPDTKNTETNRKFELATETNYELIIKYLDNVVATQLVLTGSTKVPDNLPTSFLADYDNSLLMGPAGDRRIIAKFLAEQMVEVGVGPGVKIIGPTPIPAKADKESHKLNNYKTDEMEELELNEDKEEKAPKIVENVLINKEDDEERNIDPMIKNKLNMECSPISPQCAAVPTPVPPPTVAIMSTPTPTPIVTSSFINGQPFLQSSKVKTLKLNEVTRPLAKPVKRSLLLGAVKRLLYTVTTNSNYTELSGYKNGQDEQSEWKQLPMQNKIITTLAATFSDVVRESILEHVVNDLKTSMDIALGWLYEEYSIMQGFSRIPELRRTTRIEHSYNNLLGAFVRAACGFPAASISTVGGPPIPSTDTAISQTSPDGATLTRLLLEAPIITEPSLEQVSVTVCRNENSAPWVFALLRELAIRRPTRQLFFLQVILAHTTHENQVIREEAVKNILLLYPVMTLKPTIDTHILRYVDALTESQPPVERLAGESQGRVKMEAWSDSLAQACLDAFVAILPKNEALIHCLARVYVETGADVKRTILRMMDAPIKAMGMNSSELLRLVEDCPKGSETLVTRVIHILTDKDLPTQALVQRVRELYNTRVSDVRFLIPVLNGLMKAEIVAAMPKLIKLNPVVVKEVFNRLLGAHGECSISPTELLVSLHVIDTNKADIKTKMKAITLCLNEKQVFTQEVLAVVLQQLMEETPLPTLLMRTVIQGLSLYPRLSGFVMNILQRLILKQVWKQRVVWEGFVKCCYRTKPQSFGVLLQLPSPQLTEALIMCPEMRNPLKENLLTFTDVQRAHIPSTIQEIILGSKERVCVGTVGSVSSSILPEPVAATQDLAIVNPLEPLPPGME